MLLATPLSASSDETNLIRKECPRYFDLYSGEYCFLIDDSARKSQSEATSFCAENGATLSYPTGDLETWLGAVAEVIGEFGIVQWTGATYENGVWQWVDGSLVQ